MSNISYKLSDFIFSRTIFLYYLLTYLSHGAAYFWKADSHSACQTIACFLYGAVYFLKSWMSLSFLKKSCFFMELEGSLSRSQKPATGPYPDLTESSSTHRSLSP
jgi:hypothetical protein